MTDIPNQEIVGQFIDAAVHDQAKATQLLREYPGLRDARWMGETLLHFLAVEAYAEAVRFLGKLGFDPNAPSESGDPPLIDVAVLGNPKIAAILIESGADPNAASTTWDNVLHAAVRSGNAALVKLLLEAGADPHYITDLEHTIFDALPQKLTKRKPIEAILAEYGVQRPTH